MTGIAVWQPPRHDGPPRALRITAGQRNVLESLCEGKDTAGVCADWGISPNTVGTHVRELLRRAGARDRVALVAKVHRGELVPRVAPPHGRSPRQAATLARPATYPPAL